MLSAVKLLTPIILKFYPAIYWHHITDLGWY